MAKTQVDLLVHNIRKHGIVSRAQYINHCIKRGQVMDQGLAHARVKSINDNKQDYNIPEGMMIGKVVVKGENNLVEHLYLFVDAANYIQKKAKEVTSFYFKHTKEA